MAVAVRHQEAVGIAKYTVQARVVAAPLGNVQAKWCVAVDAVQAGAQVLPGLPQGRGVVSGVVTVDAPALIIFVEQCHGDAGDAPTLGHAAQVFAEHLGQAVGAAHAQLFAHQGGELVVLFALLHPYSVGQQVSDVQQVQGPAVALRLDPAAGMQDLASSALEVEVQAVSLPLLRRALDTPRAVGTQQGLQGGVGRVGKMLGK